MGLGSDVANLIKQAAANAGVATPGGVDQVIRKRRVCILRTSGALGTNTDDAAANTATAEQQIFWTSVAITVTALEYVPNAAIVADAANNATITFTKRTAAGGSLTTLGTITTNVALGNLAAGQGAPATLTATSDDLKVAAGSSIGVANTKAGTGVALRAGVYILEYTED